MKLMHLSDLHLGKRLIEVSILEDQKYILEQIADIAAAERPQAVLICGDVYDRSNPPVEAMTLFSDFIGRLTALGCRVLAISGNHDSPDRVAYLGGLIRAQGVYVSPVYDGHIETVTLEDEFGPVVFYLMPFIHPEVARGQFPEANILTADDAARQVLGGMEPDPGVRNVVLSHQFIAGSTFDEREQKAVGTLDNVDPALYDGFDYVALGHIHREQAVGRADGTMRYCGTPLKYSRKEIGADKTVTLVTLGRKGEISMEKKALTPLRELCALRGPFDELIARGPEPGQEDYFFITLTDEEDVPHAAARLRERFGRVLSVDYDNARTRAAGSVELEAADAEDKSPMELLMALYREANHREMSEEAQAFALRVMREVEGFEQ